MHWPKFTKALLFLFIIMKGILLKISFFKMLWGYMKKVTGCSEDDGRGRSCAHIPGTYWLPRLSAPGFGGFATLPGRRANLWQGVVKQRTAWAPFHPCSTWEAPRNLSKALSVLSATTDRVVSHCNSGIQCRNNFSTLKTGQMFEASSEGRLPERCVFVVIIWICFVGHMKDVVTARRRQLHWKLLLFFFFLLLPYSGNRVRSVQGLVFCIQFFKIPQVQPSQDSTHEQLILKWLGIAHTDLL